MRFNCFRIKGGGFYGLPYRALLPKGLDNLFAGGMMITPDWEAHMSSVSAPGRAD